MGGRSLLPTWSVDSWGTCEYFSCCTVLREYFKLVCSNCVRKGQITAGVGVGLRWKGSPKHPFCGRKP